MCFGQWLATLNSMTLGSAALPRVPQLVDQARFFEVSEGAGDLAHGDLERVFRVRQVIAGGSEARRDRPELQHRYVCRGLLPDFSAVSVF